MDGQPPRPRLRAGEPTVPDAGGADVNATPRRSRRDADLALAGARRCAPVPGRHARRRPLVRACRRSAPGHPGPVQAAHILARRVPAAPARAGTATAGPSARPETSSWKAGRGPRRGIGGGVRLIRPSLPHTDAIIAVGGIEDDWALRKNLRWLGEHGLERLGVAHTPGPRAAQRHNPGTALQARAEAGAAGRFSGCSLVIKTAALPADEDAEPAVPSAAAAARGSGASPARRGRMPPATAPAPAPRGATGT